MALDIRTLCLASSASMLSLALVMTYVVVRRKTYPGFGAWVGATWCAFLGMSLLTLRGMVPDALSVHLANAGLYSSALLVTMGLSAFTGGRVARGWYLAVLLVTLGLNALFLHWHPSLQGRVVLFSLVTGGICAYGAFLAWARVPRVLEEPNGLIHYTLLFLAITYMLRGVATLLVPPADQQFMSPSPIQAGALLAYICSHGILFAGLVVVNSHRVERDLHRALDDYQRLRELIPICATCKQIRDDQGAWAPLESFLHRHAGVSFTHGVCPDCAEAFRRQAGLGAGMPPLA